MSYYENPHYSQYAASAPIVRSEGCTPSTGSNGIDASTGGAIVRTPDQMWALIPEDEQQNPSTPGWSLVDLDRACAKINVPFTNRSGGTWDSVIQRLESGLYVALQGDCDQLSSSGCSGFMGPHCLGVHPFKHSTKGQRVNEPTRSDYTYYSLDKLKAYATKFSGSANSIYYGTFDTPVPQVGGSAMSRFVQANGYGVGSGTLVTVPAGTAWKYLDDSVGGTLTVETTAAVFGAVDSHKNEYLVSLYVSEPYSDGTARTTLVLLETTAPLADVPVVPPASDLPAQQEQWDKDAVAVLGPRPA